MCLILFLNFNLILFYFNNKFYFFFIIYNFYFFFNKKGSDGIVEFWDYRSREKIKSMIVGSGKEEVSEIKSDGSGLVYGVGTELGRVSLFDIRYERSL
jgi:WD40 repeat protein